MRKRVAVESRELARLINEELRRPPVCNVFRAHESFFRLRDVEPGAPNWDPEDVLLSGLPAEISHGARAAAYAAVLRVAERYDLAA